MQVKHIIRLEMIFLFGLFLNLKYSQAIFLLYLRIVGGDHAEDEA